MKINSYLFSTFFLAPFLLFSAEFTVSSYNCGGLSDHYDYLRSAAMYQLMQERYNTEPEMMSINEKIQQLALKILFSEGIERENTLREWNDRNCSESYLELMAAETNLDWHKKVNESITDYKTRPVCILDKNIKKMLKDQATEFTNDKENKLSELIPKIRRRLAERIFTRHMNYDIICLQEVNSLISFEEENPSSPSIFPESHQLLFTDSNGIAWNKERFELLEKREDSEGRALIIKLKDNKTDDLILIASVHLSGCNPYQKIITEYTDPKKGNVKTSDSEKGDLEISSILKIMEEMEASIKLIAMDSNVTSLHPRLEIIKNAGFKLDYENFIEMTCTNPYQALNTRIDWIFVNATNAAITNIPVLNIGLNSIQTNMSDHKPIAAKIKYESPKVVKLEIQGEDSFQEENS